MTSRLYLVSLAALAGILLVLRITLPAYSVDGVLFSRMTQMSIFVALCVYALPVIVGMRAWNAGMKLPWGVALFLLLTACEPLLRFGAGDYFSPNNPLRPGDWGELLILGLVLAGFLVLRGGAELSARGRLFERGAGILALVAILTRPSVCFGSLSRLPVIGDFISYSSVFLTGLLRFENLMTAIKGFGLGWSVFGNSLLVLGFAGCLLLLCLVEGRVAR